MFVKVVVMLLVMSVVAADQFELTKEVRRRIKVGMCRASCLDEFNMKRNLRFKTFGCSSMTKSTCPMCWDYCDDLNQPNAAVEEMCIDDICYTGCQHACKFHAKGLSETGVVQTVQISRPIVENRHVLRKMQNKLAHKSQHVVNVGFTTVDGQWREIDQTTNTHMPFPLHLKSEQVVIIAVTSTNIVAYNATTTNFALASDTDELYPTDGVQQNPMPTETTTELYSTMTTKDNVDLGNNPDVIIEKATNSVTNIYAVILTTAAKLNSTRATKDNVALGNNPDVKMERAALLLPNYAVILAVCAVGIVLTLCVLCVKIHRIEEEDDDVEKQKCDEESR